VSDQHNNTVGIQAKPETGQWKWAFKSWSYEFMDRIRASNSARRIWRKIQTAGFPDGAALLLHLFSIEADRDPEMCRRTTEAKKRLRAAIRAVGRSTAPKGRRGPSRKTTDQLVAEALASPWPGGREFATIGDATKRLKLETGKELTQNEILWRLKDLGERSPLNNERFSLVRLQVLAETRGVKLGYKAVATLAKCAGNFRYEKESSRRELQRYLKQFPDHEPILADMSPDLEIIESRVEFAHLFAPLHRK
jgi:hypothetical protein